VSAAVPEGALIPNVKFLFRSEEEWHEYTSADLFRGKRIVLFGLPGAFTPC
jgi:peroxiredoxin